jgi:hypothetical protein
MLNDRKRFEDVAMLTAVTAPELGKLVRAHVLDGWDLFGGMHTDGGIWAQWVVRYLPKAVKVHPSGAQVIA